MTAIEAKFAREAKDRPTDWIIVPHRGRFKLVNLRGEASRELSMVIVSAERELEE